MRSCKRVSSARLSRAVKVQTGSVTGLMEEGVVCGLVVCVVGCGCSLCSTPGRIHIRVSNIFYLTHSYQLVNDSPLGLFTPKDIPSANLTKYAVQLLKKSFCVAERVK